MKTAMQELIWFMSDGLNEIDEGIRVSEVWIKAKELLQKEKQQIIDSNNSGWRTHRRKENQNAEEYYSETFNLK